MTRVKILNSPEVSQSWETWPCPLYFVNASYIKRVGIMHKAVCTRCKKQVYDQPLKGSFECSYQEWSLFHCRSHQWSSMTRICESKMNGKIFKWISTLFSINSITILQYSCSQVLCYYVKSPQGYVIGFKTTSLPVKELSRREQRIFTVVQRYTAVSATYTSRTALARLRGFWILQIKALMKQSA